MGYSIQGHADGYGLSFGEGVLATFTLSGAPYAIRHKELSEQQEYTKYRIGHKILMVVQCIPGVGLLAAIIERIVVYVAFKFKQDNKVESNEEPPQKDRLVNNNLIPNESPNTGAVKQINEMSNQEIYKKAAQLIFDADVLFISAGAGMGVPGGLGTFRGTAAGVWPPLNELGLQFQDMSNPARFVENDKYGPLWAWSFWKWRYCAYTETQPHEGYRYLLNWSKKKNHPAFVFTTNIDGHFLKAGFEKVLERHGTVQFLQCQRVDSKCPNFNKKWLPEKGLI
ncbi:MAG TPA: Sir2 family NAD-dependent protein deacetylase, partial [Waddliaceae bacterium]